MKEQKISFEEFKNYQIKTAAAKGYKMELTKEQQLAAYAAYIHSFDELTNLLEKAIEDNNMALINRYLDAVGIKHKAETLLVHQIDQMLQAIPQELQQLMGLGQDENGKDSSN